MKQADMLLDMMEYGSAIAHFQKILSQNPGVKDVRKKIGYAYFQLENIDDALEFLKEVHV
ncbi:MAG: tetratricopeptide repeat protein [Candidatus Heimdallarchaeota archaeon]